MKKMMLIALALSLSLVLMAGTSLAVQVKHTANQNADINESGNPVAKVNLSKNVSLGYTPDTNNQEYAIQSYHVSGNKSYGTASDTTIIKWETKTDKVDIDAPTDSNSGEFDGWTAM